MAIILWKVDRTSAIRVPRLVKNFPDIVPDLLQPGLKLVFCGTAPSRASAQAQAYYAKPGNRFWRTLHEIALTPKLYTPQQYRDLLSLGIGLTDLCKTHSGNDDELPADGIDVARLLNMIEHYQPERLAFTSQTAGRIALGRTVRYGWQPATIGNTRVYVCCSTSGRARRFFDLRIWQELARDLRIATA